MLISLQKVGVVLTLLFVHLFGKKNELSKICHLEKIISSHKEYTAKFNMPYCKEPWVGFNIIIAFG